MRSTCVASSFARFVESLCVTSNQIQPERISVLNDRETTRGNYVLYWMQQSQRAEWNHALEYAVQRANQLDQRLLVVFGLMDDYPEANQRHYQFMLQGLQETQGSLAKRGIKLVVRRGAPHEVATEFTEDASLVVCDRGYLRHQKGWREHVAHRAKCEVVQIEADVVVPVETASDKREYAARTIRPKLSRHHQYFLVDLRATVLKKDSLNLRVGGLDLSNVDRLLDDLRLDDSVRPVAQLFPGGTQAAKRVLRSFINKRLKNYDEHRNQPDTDEVSYMSMYLHFGQISPVYVAREIECTSHGSKADRAGYLEELLIRRELAQNFVHFEPKYDSYACLPRWARDTLREHRSDPREFQYTKQQLEDAETHDKYWNAAMREMRYTGYMHNYMRMYWGKKIIEWTNTPEYAYQVALELNNRYFLDGRDPNSFANVAWLFGNHDRAFAERQVFGKIRYMSQGGLQRKADADAYVEKVDKLVDRVS